MIILQHTIINLLQYCCSHQHQQFKSMIGPILFMVSIIFIVSGIHLNLSHNHDDITLFLFVCYWYIRWYIMLRFQVWVHPLSSYRQSCCFCCSISYIHIDNATTTIIWLLIQFWSFYYHCPWFPSSQIITWFDQASCLKCHFHHIHLVSTVAFASFFKDSCN